MTLFTSKCASRHNGGQFFIFYLTSRLRTRHFREPTFRPSEPQNNVKTHCFANSLPFRAPAFSLFWLSPFLIFSVSYLLPFDFLHELLPGCAFPPVHIVGSLTSKLPSILYICICLPCDVLWKNAKIPGTTVATVFLDVACHKLFFCCWVAKLG